MRVRPVLLEIGLEEIPARFIPAALENLKEQAVRVFGKAGVPFLEVETFATPRRLAVRLKGIPEQQEDRVREVFGPPRQAAYAPDGTPTKAALGFARSQGVEPDALVIKKKDKGEYVAAVIEEKGRAVEELLPDMLREMVLSLHFPKSMRWGHGEVRFARPIQWLVALYGGRDVTFEVEGIRSGRQSRGHRFLSSRTVTLRGPADYEPVLEKKRVMVGLSDRMESIRGQARKLASRVKGMPALDEELLSITACLVEYPVCVLGGFSADYLSLPDELLTAVMVGHQKYIPIQDKEGKILNSFVIVSNTSDENADMVRVGAERVIRARFDDARFYFEEDRKVPLAGRLEALKKVTFQEKLGSVHEKTMRTRAVAEKLAASLVPEKHVLAARSAELSKTDLITGVVREFPELQGVMGMYYARNDGEDGDVAEALREQYLPLFSGGEVPETGVGTVLALADRADNLASFFSIGLKPSGSEDPFALRRQALGIIAILGQRELPLSVRDMMEPAFSGIEGRGVEDEVLSFFEQRFEPLLSGRGYAYDLVQSVLSRSTELPVSELLGRLEALKEFQKQKGYNEFLVAIKRVKNILPEGGPEAPGEALFQADEERALFAALQVVEKDVEKKTASSDYPGAISGLMTLTGPINDFFDQVLVMDKDEQVKATRLALLSRVWAAASRVADFSKLQEK
jgi:glycyl-tRNA synthetase beta chain